MVLSVLLDQSKPLSTPQQGCMIAVFLGLNLSLNMMGKFVLGTYGFRFAAALTICHLVGISLFQAVKLCMICTTLSLPRFLVFYLVDIHTPRIPFCQVDLGLCGHFYALVSGSYCIVEAAASIL